MPRKYEGSTTNSRLIIRGRIDAARRLTEDATATTTCPKCRQPAMRLRDAALLTPRSVEKEIYCGRCGAHNFLLLKTDPEHWQPALEMLHRSVHAKFNTAADGHCLLALLRPRLWSPLHLRLLLCSRYGFRRQGRRIIGRGEAQLPSYVRGDLHLHAAYDQPAGFALHTDPAAADAFLRQFAADHFGAVAALKG